MRTAGWAWMLALAAPATAFTAVAGPATVSGRVAAVRGWGGATIADFSDSQLANLGSAGPCKWQRNARTRSALRMSGGGASGSSLMSSLTLSRNKMLAFLQAQFLPVGLLLAVFVGVCFPQPGAAFGKIAVTKYAASGIFLIGGLKLRTAEAVEALRDVKSIVFGVFSILFLTVVVGARLARAMPLSVPEFITGLTLFMCMPCTISSGAALAAQAGGNIALGLILTVICSTFGVFTVPVMLDMCGGFGNTIQLPVLEMIQKLVVTVLLPLAIGKSIAATSDGAKACIKQYSSPLTYLSHLFIIITPWIQISNTTLKGTFATVALWDIFAAVAAGGFLHLVFVAVNLVGAKLIRLTEDMTKSVVFVASSKTLPLALTILTILPPAIGEKGLIALPCILGHFSQIVIDSFIVAAWQKKSDD